MMRVEATISCITEDCFRIAKVPMIRGYEDGVWRIPGTGRLLGSDRPNILGLEDWGNIGRHFGERESWSNAICPECFEKAKIEVERPKTLCERVTAIEKKLAKLE